jgi:Zn-dependent peptidase ImmA (M78 family)
VTFLAPAQLEARAAELWRRFGLAPNFDAEALLDALELNLLWDDLDDDEGAKVFGALVPAKRVVVLNERHIDLLEAKPGLRRFTLGHEVGHWMLHVERAGTQLCFLDGIERVWCRERSQDPRERQAESFAGYLLAPTDLLKREVRTSPWQGWAPVYALAEAFGMTPTAMMVRLEVAGWAHRDGDRIPRSGPRRSAGQLSLLADDQC